jgi:hypothetical protein
MGLDWRRLFFGNGVGLFVDKPRSFARMRAPRVYPSWLPPNPRERMELLKMRRRQHLVIAWMVGLIPGGWIVVLFAPDESFFVPFTLLWIAVGLWFAERLGATRCPRCGSEFSEKHELTYWSGLFNSRCENCGLTLGKTAD